MLVILLSCYPLTYYTLFPIFSLRVPIPSRDLPPLLQQQFAIKERKEAHDQAQTKTSTTSTGINDQKVFA